MNVNDITSYLYNSALTNATEVAGASNVNASQKTQDSINEAVTSFSQSLDEEVSKISQITELASVLDDTVLGNIVKNSSESDLQALSEDLLGSSGGREVLAKLMEGQFNSIVMTDSDDDDDNSFDQALDTYSQSVSDTQSLLDNLESVMENMATSTGEA